MLWLFDLLLLEKRLRERDVLPLTEIERWINQGALFFCNHSGGKDAQAMYLALRKIVPKEQLIVLHVKIGDQQWRNTFSHIQNTVDGDCVLLQSEKDIFDIIKHRGMFPSPKHNQCHTDLKIRVLEKEVRRVMKERGAKLAINCSGLRPKDQKYYRVNKRLSLFNKKSVPKHNQFIALGDKNVDDYDSPNFNKRVVYDFFPLVNISDEESFSIIERNGQVPHYAYDLGVKKLSCHFCIRGSKNDLTISAKERPELLERFLQAERETNHTMFYSNFEPISLLEMIEVDSSKREESTQVEEENFQTIAWAA